MTGQEQSESVTTGREQKKSTMTGPEQEQSAAAGQEQSESIMTAPEQNESSMSGPEQEQSAAAGQWQNHPAATEPQEAGGGPDGSEEARKGLQAGDGADGRFEAVLEQCGGAGRWQWRILLLTSAVGALSGFHNVSSLFLGATPEHWCRLPTNASGAEPLPADAGRCRYLANGSEAACHAWEFDTSQYRSTVVSEWSLVCGRRWLYSTVQASFMLGKLFGYPVLGALSDRFGRRRTSLAAAAAQLLVASAVALSPHYAMFLTLRLLVGALTGINSTLFTLAVEATGPRLRATTGILFAVPYSLGLMALPGVAYLVRDWRHLQLAISLPYGLVLTYYWLLPESPRWLVERGRHREALVVLQAAARANRRPPPDQRRLLAQLEACPGQQQGAGGGCDRLTACCTALRLLATPVMRRRLLASMWMFIITNAIYYGVQFDSAQLSGSPYLATFLSGLVEIPANLAAVPLINRVGRRPSTCGLLLLTAAAILAILAVPARLAWPKLLLAITGKMFITAVFSIIYLYVIEYTPTPLRNGGLGLATSSGRLGSVAAPYVVDLLAPVHWSLPSCVFGVAAVSGALVVLLLPETRRRRLPESIEDVESRNWEKPIKNLHALELGVKSQ